MRRTKTRTVDMVSPIVQEVENLLNNVDRYIVSAKDSAPLQP